MQKSVLRYCIPVLGVLCIVTGSLYAQGSGRKCTIKSMVGDVKVQRSKSPKWIKARPNMPLRQNDAIRTFVESEAVIQTADGSRISLKENTTLELATLTKSRDGASKTGIRILSGNLMANVRKLVNKKSKFEFETPTAVAAIRGTRVGFDVDKNKTAIKVYEGKVYVVPKGARKGAELKSNEMTTVVKGQKKVKIQVLREPEEEEKKAAAVDTTGGVTDTSTADTTAIEEDTTASADTTGDVKFVLKVFSPENGQVISPEAQISVTGKVFPPKAVVRVRGSEVPVKPNGEFSRIVNAPKEEAQYSIEIEAVFEEQSKTVTRYVVIKTVPVDLKLVVNEPRNGQVVNKPLIRVSGTVTPGAEVTVSGMNISVAPNGGFSKDVPIPDEEGEIVLEIEAVLNQETKTESRTVIYKMPEEDLILTVQMPADKQIICDRRKVQVKGMVKPVSIKEVSVNGTDVPVRNGMFSDNIIIPDEPGEQDIEFEINGENDSKTIRRIVIYDPSCDKCNVDIPTIQPSSLPLNSKISRIAFTVYDKTASDEITFFSSVDKGSEDSETGAPDSRFYLDLEEGIHTYEVYAKDLAGNKSQVITGTVSNLINNPMIRLINPSGPYKLLHIPPSTPLGDFRPEFTIEFSVENLPDDNPELLKEIKVINKLSGDIKSQKKFTTDIDFDFDINLKRGRNPITIEVRDVNDRITTRDLVIEIK